ncbi:FtsB family cell division protein [Mucilaginibacter paludis]|uniref:Septum formation initiator n=1 Tax=Mucilaginibacter paludis DSM 18603 TaxID=714943 RepID=H1Y6V6_9SPHI|nr:septum formation initiator family protein [Mucilaginibacter paludis]EHQ28363.1 Septum formation initiator [Mucilaginibacter paludis DSM 18603]
MKRLIDLLKNKFFLVTIAFMVWMIFLDKNDLYSQYSKHNDVVELEKQRDFLLQQNAQVTKDLDELTSDKQKLEKFAREKYLMKKDNEDIFVVVRKKKEEK